MGRVYIFFDDYGCYESEVGCKRTGIKNFEEANRPFIFPRSDIITSGVLHNDSRGA